MLINFTVNNYRSFMSDQTFSMEASNISEHTESLIKRGNGQFLPLAVVFGANASGKSNFLKALTMMKIMVMDSVRLNPEDELHFVPFLLVEGQADLPTTFEVEFFLEKTHYRYGFEYNSERVSGEWLYEIVQLKSTVKEKRLFNREDNTIEVNDKLFKEGKPFVNNLNPNRLFLSLVAQLNGPIAYQIIGWFSRLNLISGIEKSNHQEFTMTSFENEDTNSKQAQELFKRMKLGFKEVSIKTEKAADESDAKTLFTIHDILDKDKNVVDQLKVPFNAFESDGTIKVFGLSAIIFDALQHGGTLLIDELDAKLHVFLIEEIIKLFNDPKVNTTGAQLIFTAHSTHMLRSALFRRDEIWFTEKDEWDATNLYSLVEFKQSSGSKPRKDQNYEKAYLEGRFGAIPYIDE